MNRIIQVRVEECTPGKRNSMCESYRWESHWYTLRTKSLIWPCWLQPGAKWKEIRFTRWTGSRSIQGEWVLGSPSGMLSYGVPGGHITYSIPPVGPGLERNPAHFLIFHSPPPIFLPTVMEPRWLRERGGHGKVEGVLRHELAL